MILCACGCGTVISEIDNYGRPKSFVWGHSGKNKKHSVDWNINISEGHLKGRYKNYRPYFCECGCGEITTHGRRFMSGHNKNKTEVRTHRQKINGLTKKELERNCKMQSPSKPQVELFNRVKSIYEGALLNYPYKRYFIDVAVPSLKLAIEYDGSYWHKNKEEKDKKKQKDLEIGGWKVIRYRDYVPSIQEIREVQ